MSRGVLVRAAIVHDAPGFRDLRCHAGAGHGNAADRGSYGELCGPCFAAVLRVLKVMPPGAEP